MCTFLRILFHLHQMHWHFRAGYFTTRVSTAFLLLRRAGGLEGKTVCGETQTWWFSTAEKNRCVCVCVCVGMVHFSFSQLCCHDNRRCYRWKQEFASRLRGPSWIGLSDRETEGTFKWVDGSPMTSR